MNNLAPIILFVYNRPTHTRRTLQTLESVNLANESEIYIFSDGAKTAEQIENVNNVRAILREPWDFKKIHIIERAQNMGLANNVITGVTKVINLHKKAIVLEDDVLLSPYALEYFNEALVKYELNEKVMHIGSYIYNIDKSNLEETFFTRLVSSQAWATWDRSWQHFQPNIDEIISQFDKQKIKEFSFEHTMNFWRQINQQKDSKIDSWAVRWYASVFLKGGLALQCSSSLIHNIGHDGTGIHSEISNIFDSEVKNDKVLYFPDNVEESKVGYEALKKFFAKRKGSLFARAIRFVKNKLNIK